MSFMRNQRASGQSNRSTDAGVGTGTRPRGGPIITIEEQQQGKRQPFGIPRHLPARSKLESIAFWIIGVAAVVLVLLFVVPSLFNAVTAAFYTSLFVLLLTLSNLQHPSGWANTILGRKVFPVIHTGDLEIWKLAVVNSALVFVFAFMFELLSRYLGAFLSGIVVFGGLVALGVFFSRARNAINRP